MGGGKEIRPKRNIKYVVSYTTLKFIIMFESIIMKFLKVNYNFYCHVKKRELRNVDMIVHVA